MNESHIETVRNGLRVLNRKAGVLKSDPYGIGLPLSHCSTLVDISRHGHIRPNQLIALLMLDKSTISRIIANLESKDLIKVTSDTEDARSKVLALTQKGKKLVEIINDVSNDTVRELFENLSPKERQMIAESFGLILKVLGV